MLLEIPHTFVDFGIEHLVSIAKETTFPWLLSNVRERSNGRLLAEGLETLVLPWEGRKVTLQRGSQLVLCIHVDRGSLATNHKLASARVFTKHIIRGMW